MNRIFPRIGWACLALLVLLLVTLVVARVLFSRYLRSEAFRRTLGEAAANTFHASRADFSPLEFDGSLVYGQNFHALREDGGGFSTMDADQLRANFDWHGLLRHTVQIDELSVQRLTVQPPATGGRMGETPEPPDQASQASQASRSGGGWMVDLRKAVIGEANWQWSAVPAGGIDGTALTLTPEGQNGWSIEAQGGTVQEAGWPVLKVDSASLRWQSPTLYINSSSLREGAGQVSLTGEVETREEVKLHAKFEGVDVQPFLTPDWRERLSGRLEGDADFEMPLGTGNGEKGGPGTPSVSGSLTLLEGRLTALPILDQLGLFTHTERFRQLDLTRATADFTRTPARVAVRNLVAESAGLIRVEGSYVVENGNIAGNFRVGLTPATLQWIPGSQEEIFTDSRAGYLWTSMNLNGPVEHPADDLTPRLVAAAGGHVIEGVQGAVGTVKKAAESVLDSLLH